MRFGPAWTKIAAERAHGNYMQKQILLIEDRPNQQLLYRMNLHLYLGLQVITKKSFYCACQYLDRYPHQISLIISKMDEDDLPFKISYYLKERDERIPILALGEDSRAEGYNITKLNKQSQLGHVIKASAKYLGVTAKEMANENVEDYFALPINYFSQGLVSNYPVYCLKEKDGREKLSLIISAGTRIGPEKVDFLRSSGLNKLYIRAEHRLKMIDDFSAQLLVSIKNEKTSDTKKMTIGQIAQDMFQEQGRSIGITQKVIDLTNESIEQMKNISIKIPKLEILMNILIADEKSYRLKKSYLTSYITTYLLEKIDWANREHYDKLVMASFYHDLTLPNDRLAQISTEEELDEQTDLGQKEKDTVRKHAQKAALLLAKYNIVPSDVVTIVKQHHGDLLGEKLGTIKPTIGPLSALFIVAERWAHYTLRSSDSSIKLNKEKVITLLEKDLSHQVFKKHLKIIKELSL